MSFRLVPKSATLNNLERHNGRYLRYFTEFGKHAFQHITAWRNLCTSVLYFVVRARCRRKESSRSLSHLLVNFLLFFSVFSAHSVSIVKHLISKSYYFVLVSANQVSA